MLGCSDCSAAPVNHISAGPTLGLLFRHGSPPAPRPGRIVFSSDVEARPRRACHTDFAIVSPVPDIGRIEHVAYTLITSCVGRTHCSLPDILELKYACRSHSPLSVAH
jgi:hypothetical protein